MPDPLRLLVMADVHHSSSSPLPGLELVQRVNAWAERTGFYPAAVILLGDLVDEEAEEAAVEVLRAIRNLLKTPVIAVRGNHDPAPSLFNEVFGPVGQPLDLGAALIVPFTDRYDESDQAWRDPDALASLRETARRFPDRVIIAVQHNPLHPLIEDEYPYVLMEAQATIDAYREAGVVLSLSGHYHPGQSPTVLDGVTYATCPALKRAPYSFLTVEVEDRNVRVTRHDLAPADERRTEVQIEDFHCHTEFAYCGSGINITDALIRADAFGVQRQHFTEHAGQLCLPRNEFWNASFLRNPDVWLRAREQGPTRMDDYLATMRGLASPRVGIGLEVDCDGAGRLMVTEEDREHLDVLVGAVHFLPELASKHPDPTQLVREFMHYTECLVRGGVTVLAHPFRIFQWAKLPAPVELFPVVADLLAQYGCAAELNFHVHTPEPEFCAQCIERGVLIALGSDSHRLYEAGGFLAHIDFLKSIAPDRDVNSLLLHSLKT